MAVGEATQQDGGGSGPCREPASLPCHLLFFACGLLISSVPIATAVISENITVTRFLFCLKGAGLFLHPHGSLYLVKVPLPTVCSREITNSLLEETEAQTLSKSQEDTHQDELSGPRNKGKTVPGLRNSGANSW